jgi:hypothetical protein
MFWPTEHLSFRVLGWALLARQPLIGLVYQSQMVDEYRAIAECYVAREASMPFGVQQIPHDRVK